MYCVHLYGLHVYCALVDLDSSGSPGVGPTPGLTSSTQVVCVYVREYTSTRTHLTLTPAKIEKCTRQNPYLQPCQNTASYAKTPLPTPPTHACKCQETPAIHAHVVERLDSTNKQNSPTRVHTYIHMRAHTNAHAYIYTEIHTYIHTHTHAPIHAHMHTHTHTHVYAHACTHRKPSNNASTCQAIIDAYTHP